MENLSVQQKRVFDYLREHKQATAREIILNCGTNYASSLVRDLKKKGVNIISKPVPNTNYEIYEIAQ